MSILAVNANSLVRVTTFKQLVSQPDVRWVNTYELRKTASPPVPATPASLADLVDGIAEWERVFTSTAVLIERGIVATWTPDSVPYQGNEFIDVPINESGTRVIAGEQLSLNQCLRVIRQPLTGRRGSILLRGALGEGDVSGAGGSANLTSAFLLSLRQSMATDQPGDLVGVVEGLGFELVMVNTSPLDETPSVRRVVSVNPADRVSFKQLNNRYFRRNAPNPGPTP